jgi:hypothetical protein
MPRSVKQRLKPPGRTRRQAGTARALTIETCLLMKAHKTAPVLFGTFTLFVLSRHGFHQSFSARKNHSGRVFRDGEARRSENKPLMGENKYVLTLEPAFWSATMYNYNNNYTVENPINRYSPGSDNELIMNKDDTR